MADRHVLEFNGTVFESAISRLLKRKYPEAVVLSVLSSITECLHKDTQNDLLMIHPRGVFVIEAKGWRKWVRGEYSDTVWQGVSSQMSIMTRPSPINQNRIHIRALRNAIRSKLGINPVKFFNLVVFPDHTDLRTSCTEVVNIALMKLMIDRVILQQNYVIDVEEYKKMILSVTDKVCMEE